MVTFSRKSRQQINETDIYQDVGERWRVVTNGASFRVQNLRGIFWKTWEDETDRMDNQPLNFGSRVEACLHMRYEIQREARMVIQEIHGWKKVDCDGC